MHHVFVGHAIDFSIALNCIACHGDRLLDKCSLWSFLNDCSCLIKLCFIAYISFGILIAFYLFLIRTLCSTCCELNESLLYVQVFQDTGLYGASASQLLELSVSEFYLCFQTQV